MNCDHQTQRVEVKKLTFSSSILAESTACCMYVKVLTETVITVVGMKYCSEITKVITVF